MGSKDRREGAAKEDAAERRPARERILSCALREFLDKGFVDASLRSIASAAQVTTGAIYGYVSSKEALFDAVVAPAGEELYRRFEAFQENFYRLPLESQLLDRMLEYEGEVVHNLIDFVYDQRNCFTLILLRSAGTPWANYPGRFALLEELSAHRYALMMRERGIETKKLAPATARILAGIFVQGFFEPFICGMTRAEAHGFMEDYLRFFHAGYATLMEQKQTPTS